MTEGMGAQDRNLGAAFPADGIASREELFHAADQALYRVKHQGRGGIDLAGEIG